MLPREAIDHHTADPPKPPDLFTLAEPIPGCIHRSDTTTLDTPMSMRQNQVDGTDQGDSSGVDAMPGQMTHIALSYLPPSTTLILESVLRLISGYVRYLTASEFLGSVRHPMPNTLLAARGGKRVSLDEARQGLARTPTRDTPIASALLCK